MTCPARVYGTKLFWGFGACRLRVDEWCRLARDDVAIMFMRNAHLGDPHATATQYVYVDGCHGRLELYQGPLLGRVGSGEDALWNARVRGQRPERLSDQFWSKLRLERGLSTSTSVYGHHSGLKR